MKRDDLRLGSPRGPSITQASRAARFEADLAWRTASIGYNQSCRRGGYKERSTLAADFVKCSYMQRRVLSLGADCCN